MSQLVLDRLPAGRTTEAAAPDAVQVPELQPAEFSGSFDFRKNWAFERQPLHFEYLLVRSKRVPEFNPLNPRYRLLIKLWQRLPFSLANLIGSHIVQNPD